MPAKDTRTATEVPDKRVKRADATVNTVEERVHRTNRTVSSCPVGGAGRFRIRFGIMTKFSITVVGKAMSIKAKLIIIGVVISTSRKLKDLEESKLIVREIVLRQRESDRRAGSGGRSLEVNRLMKARNRGGIVLVQVTIPTLVFDKARLTKKAGTIVTGAATKRKMYSCKTRSAPKVNIRKETGKTTGGAGERGARKKSRVFKFKFGLELISITSKKQSLGMFAVQSYEVEMIVPVHQVFGGGKMGRVDNTIIGIGGATRGRTEIIDNGFTSLKAIIDMVVPNINQMLTFQVRFHLAAFGFSYHGVESVRNI
jgi:hypothetical protein